MRKEYESRVRNILKIVQSAMKQAYSKLENYSKYPDGEDEARVGMVRLKRASNLLKRLEGKELGNSNLKKGDDSLLVQNLRFYEDMKSQRF